MRGAVPSKRGPNTTMALSTHVSSRSRSLKHIMAKLVGRFLRYLIACCFDCPSFCCPAADADFSSAAATGPDEALPHTHAL